MTRLYLDHNATTPPRPEVADRLADWASVAGNPSSVHADGRAARRLMEQARGQVAGMAGARPDQVIFTASGTEANNLALRGFPDRRLLVSAVEHESVLRARPDAECLAVDGEGRVDPAELRRRLAADARPALVSIMAANNETGVLQPVEALVAVAHEFDALVHCDAVQLPGRVAPAVEADLVSYSAHKLGGLKGAGALVVRSRDPLPLLLGGGQERGRRAGTENVLALAAFGLAAALARPADLAPLRDGMEAAIRARGGIVLGAGAPRLPNTSCIALPGVAAETQVIALDLAGISVSAGSACSSGKVKASHVLEAMGLAPDIAGSAIRVSLGAGSTEAGLMRFVEAWAVLAARKVA